MCVSFKKDGRAFPSPVHDHVRRGSTTSCGKNEFVAKFVQHVKQMMTPPLQRLVWCNGMGRRL